LPVAQPANLLEGRLRNRGKRKPASFDFGFEVVRLDIAQNRGLDSAVGKIKLRAIVQRMIVPRLRLRLAELRIAAVAMLDLRSLKLHGARISMRRQSIKDRSSRIAESQQLGDFIERLSRRVIASVPDIAVSPEMIVLLRK